MNVEAALAYTHICSIDWRCSVVVFLDNSPSMRTDHAGKNLAVGHAVLRRLAPSLDRVHCKVCFRTTAVSVGDAERWACTP